MHSNGTHRLMIVFFGVAASGIVLMIVALVSWVGQSTSQGLPWELYILIAGMAIASGGGMTASVLQSSYVRREAQRIALTGKRTVATIARSERRTESHGDPSTGSDTSRTTLHVVATWTDPKTHLTYSYTSPPLSARHQATLHLGDPVVVIVDRDDPNVGVFEL